MLDVSPVPPPKFKRRKVSAVRDFPKGCGVRAVEVSKPIQEPPSSLELESVSVSKPDEPPPPVVVEPAGPLKVPKEERKELNGSVLPSENFGAAAKEAENGEGMGEKNVKSEATESFDRPELVNGLINDRVLEKLGQEKKYGFPKRRKVSAVRDFPIGCGRNAPNISKEIHSEVASSESRTFDEESPVVSRRPTTASSNAVASAHKNESEVGIREKAKESDGMGSVRSPKAKSLDGEKKLVVKHQAVRPSAESSNGVESTKKDGDEVKWSDGDKLIRDKAKETDGNGSVKFPRVKSLDGEKKLKEKHQTVIEESFRTALTDKVEDEVKRNDGKKIKEVQEIEWRSGSSENIAEEHSGKKVIVRSSSGKRLDGSGMKQASKIIQTKQPRDSRLHSGSKVADKEGRSLLGKAVYKENIKHQKDARDVKRKFAGEGENEGRVRNDQSRGAESLEAYGERLIVQTLMAAENCPWRKGKKLGAKASRSVTPKNKIQRREKLLGSNFVSKVTSLREHNNEEDMEEEDSMSQDDGNEKTLTLYKGPQDGNEKALTLYKGPRELSVTMIPSVSPTLNRKGASTGHGVTRSMVKRTLRLFQLICRKLLQEEEARSKEYGKAHRADLKASAILKENNEWVNHGKPILGHVPGVEVGDEFHYRVELSIIGLHRPFQGGIDYMKRNGIVLATSIVASGGYHDDVDSSDVLIYSGSGGNSAGGDKKAGDQKLERGNLALHNSINAKTPVRVIYGFKEKGGDSHDSRSRLVTTFTYDGLYLVELCREAMGTNGFKVFKFQLRRMPGQPELSLKEVKKTKKSKVREGLCVKDIPNGKESIPICVVNTVDTEQLMPFKYITKIMYPSWYVKKPPKGCDCTDGCSDSEGCACAMKNGGEIPFNFNGAIVQAKPLVYECGPLCKCPPSCHNRVSQHGIKIPLEIFKTKSRGWGVRSLYSIPSGSFICEYIGEMLQETQAEKRSNDEYLFDIGHNFDDKSLWEGLPSFIPGLQSNATCDTVEDVGYTIDAAEYGNIGRFINHSCTPNLYAQNVLYDHDDRRIPHIMFFAADNIPPLQELTYHYNYSIDHVRDSEGNIKQKECFCGSHECTGRLY